VTYSTSRVARRLLAQQSRLPVTSDYKSDRGGFAYGFRATLPGIDSREMCLINTLLLGPGLAALPNLIVPITGANIQY
jgi:hypothetical protein